MNETKAFTAEDLRFLVETVGVGHYDPETAPALLREREDLLDVMLEDDRLVQRLLGDDQALVRVSPRFVFSVLLRRVARDLREHPYTLERRPAETIPVFDAPQVRRFIAEPAIWSYLVSMLASFVRSESLTVLVRRGDRFVRRRFSTSSLEDMMELAALGVEEEVPWIFRRIADIALFQSGIFPESLRGMRARGRVVPRALPPTLETYEEHGRRFYRLAASRSEAASEGRVLEALADEFPAARKSLELLSDRYLRWSHIRWLPAPDT
jgi:hypothetical protein